MFFDKWFKKKNDSEISASINNALLDERLAEMEAARAVPSDTTINVIGDKSCLVSIVILLSYIRYYLNSGGKGEIKVKVGYNKPPTQPFTFSVNDNIVDDIYPGTEIEIN